MVKNPPANAGNIRDAGSTPESRKIPWRRIPRKIPWRRALQPTPLFSPRESLDRGAWRTTVPRFAKNHEVT